jgi:prepilin-type N-terminal cleavage/methylation domain-containing protein
VNRSPRSAFTLLELLLALGLIALLSGIFIAGSVSLLNDKPILPQEVFWQASRAARKTALQNAAVQGGHDVRLSFDDKQKTFTADDGVTPQVFPIAKAPSDLEVDFIPDSGASANSALPGGSLDQSAPVPYVTFFGDGTCTPFNVQFRSKASTQLMEIDPWTCAQMLKVPPSS